MKLTVTDLPRLTRGRHFLSATLAALAAAAPAAPVEGPAKSPERKSSQVEVISKGSFTGVLNERAVLDQGVHIRHKDTDFYCTRMEIFFDEEKKAERAIATGSPKAVDPRNTVTGEKFTINFKERRIVIETGVKVVTRPKESSDLKAAPPSKATTERPATAAKPDGSGKEKPLRDQIKGETTITADRVEYDYRRKNLVAEGKSLTIVNRDRTVRAQRLVYTDKTEDLLLTGTPIQYRDAKGQKLDFEKELKLNLKEGAETFDYTGLFTGTFLVKDDEEDEEEDTPSAEKPASEKAKPASEPAQPTAARQP